MRRVFVLWERPLTGSLEEAQHWVEQGVSRLRQAPRIQQAELISLGVPSERRAHWHDWLLVLWLHHDYAGDVVDREPLLREFIADLRSLRMRPTVLLELEVDRGSPHLRMKTRAGHQSEGGSPVGDRPRPVDRSVANS
jgi:hypothetical protein